MGLIRSVDNIQNELQKQKELQLIEKIEKRKEKQQKEDLKRYINELEIHLKTEFDQYFKEFGSEYIFEFYNRERKKEILEQYFDTIKQIDKNGIEKIPHKIELEQHFYKKYNIILKKAHQEQKQQELYYIKTSPEAETKNKFTFNWGGIILTLLFIPVIILILPSLFILFIIIRLCKDNKIKGEMKKMELEKLGYKKTLDNEKRIIYKKINKYNKIILGLKEERHIIIINKMSKKAFLKHILIFKDEKIKLDTFCIDKKIMEAITKELDKI